MIYKVKYLIYCGNTNMYSSLRYTINSEMNKDEEIEVEFKDDDEFVLNYIKRYNSLIIIRENKEYYGFSDDDFLKFTKRFPHRREALKLVKDVIIEEIVE